MRLIAFLTTIGHHEAAWRRPDAISQANLDIGYYERLAGIAERGLLDAIFFADIQGMISSVARRPSEVIDPIVKLSAIARRTRRLGLIATASTTFDHPFNVARRFGSLDTISDGRAGWNVVATASEEVGPNFGLSTFPSPEQRYERAAEFLDVVLALWASWGHDAVVDDRAQGVYADPARVNRIDHVGEQFSVRGPGMLPPSRQGRPVVVQAGSSPAGMAFAARYAEAIFTAKGDLDDAIAFRRAIREQAAAEGRDPDGVKVFPGVVTQLASTDAEAQLGARALAERIVLDHAHQQLARETGVPIEDLDLDAVLPDNIRSPEDIGAFRSRYELSVTMARRERLTVRELLIRLNVSRAHHTFTGTPVGLADELETWLWAGACDGFTVMPATLPDGLEYFVDEVVPVLQDRGLFRTEYESATLRGNLGLPLL